MINYSEGSLATVLINYVRQNRMRIHEQEEREIYKKMLSDKVNYYDYIKSNEWKKTAKKSKERVNYHCQLCNRKGNDRTLHTHHNNYEKLGLEFDSDLIVLCSVCHKKHHV